MTDLRAELAKLALFQGIDLAEDWQGIDALVPLIEIVRQDGAVFSLKFSGQARAKDPYSVIIVGGMLQEDHIYMGGDVIDVIVASALVNYARRFWNFDS